MLSKECIARKKEENLKKRIESLSKDEQMLTPVKTKGNVGGGTGKPALMTLTWHDCGKRLSLGRKVFTALGAPMDIAISINKPFVVIRDGGGAGFQLSQTAKGKPILYSAEVVRQLIDTFVIDLSVHSTHSYYEGDYIDGAYYILIGTDEASCLDDSVEDEPEEDDLDDILDE